MVCTNGNFSSRLQAEDLFGGIDPNHKFEVDAKCNSASSFLVLDTTQFLEFQIQNERYRNDFEGWAKSLNIKENYLSKQKSSLPDQLSGFLPTQEISRLEMHLPKSSGLFLQTLEQLTSSQLSSQLKDFSKFELLSLSAAAQSLSSKAVFELSTRGE